MLPLTAQKQQQHIPATALDDLHMLHVSGLPVVGDVSWPVK